MLPPDIAELLPREIASEQVTDAARLSRGLDQTLGETLLLAHDGTLLVLTRSGFTAPFTTVALAGAARLEREEWASTLHLPGADGTAHTLELTSFDLDRVQAVLEATQAAPGAQPVPVVAPVPQDEPEPTPAPVVAPEPTPVPQDEPEPTPTPVPIVAPEPVPVTIPRSTAPEDLRQQLRQHLDSDQQDEAWCVAAALVALEQASPDEERLYQERRGGRRASARLTSSLFAALRHPDEDQTISKAMAAVGPTLARMSALPHGRFGLRRRERRDLAADPLFLSRCLAYAVAVLDVVQPELYLRPDLPQGLSLAHTVDVPSLVAGARALQQRGELELLFLCASQAALLRPEYFLSLVLPTPTQLSRTLDAALTLGNPRVELSEHSDRDAVTRLVHRLTTRLASSQLLKLEQLARGLPPAPQLDLPAWLRSVTLTSHRVGLLLCGDLPVALACVRETTSEQPLLEDLLRFGVSPAFFRARRELGLSTEEAAAGGLPLRTIDSPVPLHAPSSPGLWLGLAGLVLLVILALIMC